jgi:hypothetical protein
MTLTPARFRIALVIVLGVVFVSLQLAVQVVPPPVSSLAWKA